MLKREQNDKNSWMKLKGAQNVLINSEKNQIKADTCWKIAEKGWKQLNLAKKKVKEN